MDVTADLAQADIPWQNTWVTAYTQDGRDIPEGVTEGVELGDGESGLRGLFVLGAKGLPRPPHPSPP